MLFNAQKLIVLGDAFTAAGGAGLDLTGIERHRQVGDGSVLCLAGTVGYNGGIPGLMSHIDGLHGLRNRADLVEFDENGIAAFFFDALAQTLGIGDKQIVSHQLNLAAQFLGH